MYSALVGGGGGVLSSFGFVLYSFSALFSRALKKFPNYYRKLSAPLSFPLAMYLIQKDRLRGCLDTLIDRQIQYDNYI